jgi:hypothetical protein
MKKRIFSLLSVFLMAALLTSPVAAGRGIGFSSVTFSIGSLIADGFVTGLGKTDVTMVLDATGEQAQVSCINNGDSVVPGQSSPKINAVGIDNLAGNDQTSDFIPWNLAGCPNSNWVGHIDSVLWTGATLTVRLGYNNPNGTVLATQKYTCVTAPDRNSVSCTPVP